MKKIFSSENGFTQWIIIVVLLVGIGVGVWVAQIRTNYFPQAKTPDQKPLVQPAVISLSLAEDKPVVIGDEFLVNIKVKSDFEPVRLIATHLKFNPQDLEVLEVVATPEATRSAAVNATSSAEPRLVRISQWVETLFDNKTGDIAITGLNEQGDIKTEKNNPPFLFTQIRFKKKTNNESTIMVEDTSQIIRAQDGINLHLVKGDLTIKPVEATGSANGR